MLKNKDLNFSFAGLKTAVLYKTQEYKKISEGVKKGIALEFENAAIETLVHKTAKAVKEYNIKGIIIAGGVSANKHLKREFRRVFGKENVILPPKELTGDNALMIGVAGYLHYVKNKNKVLPLEKIKAQGKLSLS